MTCFDSFIKKAARIVAYHNRQMAETPTAYSQMLIALDYILDTAKEIAIIGYSNHKDTQKVVQYIHHYFIPNKVLALGPPVSGDEQKKANIPLLLGRPMLKGKTTTYVCEYSICQLPTSNFQKVQELVMEHKSYSLH